MAGKLGRMGILPDATVKLNTDTESDDNVEDNDEVELNTTNEHIITNDNTYITPTEQQQQCSENLPYNGTNGCVICIADNDHANLLICENCAAEYHTYCLDPPLLAVPEGDFYCEDCKHILLAKDDICNAWDINDGLEEMVLSLPKYFSARFGEIVWASGGVGFGWWPACIYDPRLTVGSARELARKHLAKKHLIYFFECHDAPFTVLTNLKLATWEDGLQGEYDLGKTAKSSGKNRSFSFEKAMQTAWIESEKPIGMRLEWNHPMITYSKNKKAKTRKRNKEKDCKDHNDRHQVLSSDTKKKPLTPNKKQTRAQAEDASAHSNTNTKTNKKQKAIKLPTDTNHNDEINQTQKHSFDISHRHNLNALLSQLPTTIEPPDTNEHEDGPLYCKIILRDDDTTHEDYSIGFITLDSHWTSTFANARYAMNKELDDDGTLPIKWKFMANQLGPISLKQEKRLVLADFLDKTTRNVDSTGIKINGNGTCTNPLLLVLKDVTKLILRNANRTIETT